MVTYDIVIEKIAPIYDKCESKFPYDEIEDAYCSGKAEGLIEAISSLFEKDPFRIEDDLINENIRKKGL